MWEHTVDMLMISKVTLEDTGGRLHLDTQRRKENGDSNMQNEKMTRKEPSWTLLLSLSSLQWRRS